MSKTDVLVASGEVVLHWTFKSVVVSKLNVVDLKKETTFHIDDCEHVRYVAKDTSFDSLCSRESTSDPITCLAISDSAAIVGRYSGALVHLSLPKLEVLSKYSVPVTPDSILINCNTTRISILDSNGILRLFDIKVTADKAGTQPVLVFKYRQTFLNLKGRMSGTSSGPKNDRISFASWRRQGFM
jgi:WD repeat-containing protein 35